MSWRQRDSGGRSRAIGPRHSRPWLGLLAVVVAWGLSGPLFFAGEARAQGASNAELSVAETEFLVRQVFFEGMPAEEAERIGPEGAARLIEMLADPEESAHHSQILVALGLSGQPGARAAIRAWAQQPLEGEIDRNAFRAWQALPIALGHLARVDPDCVDELEARLNDRGPDWTFRHHRGPRLERLQRRDAATALARTGLPAARRALDRAGQNASDADFEAHLEAMRALHDRRARERAR